MKTASLVRRYYELQKRISNLEKTRKSLGQELKKLVPFGLTVYGNYKVDKQQVEEHEVPSYTMPGHIKLTVKHK